MTASRPRFSKGFTLIELTLVTLLVLILAGLSTPLFKKTFSDLSARSTAFSIAKLVNYAQETAVLERKNYRIVFDFEKGKYQLSEPIYSEKKIEYKKVAGRFGRPFSLPQSLVLRGKKNSVIFYSDGHCDEFRVDVLAKSGGYSVSAKGFGNMVEIREARFEE